MSKLDDTTKPKDTKSVTPPSAKDWEAFAKRADELLNQVCTKSPDARHCFDFIGAGCCRCLKTENQLRQELIALEGLLGDKVNDLADEGRAVSADLSSPPQSTIDSEVTEELLALPIGNNKPLAWDMDVLVDYITRKIAQEANKARIDELERVLIMASTPKTRTSASIRKVVKSWIVFLSDELTADKEQA